jgi:hypothetical protein
MSTMALPEMAAKMEGILGGGVFGMLAGLFERMDWAEDEIKAAQRRHPAQADLMWHSFKVLCSSHELMGTEFVYRSHCRELLGRVAAGQDTRPGTSAEIACACADASQVAPLTETAAGLYSRMWAVAFPDHGDDSFTETREHYEALHAGQITELEAWSRRKLAQSDRVIEFDCGGMHHGQAVNCHGADQFKRARKGQPQIITEDEAAQADAEAAGMLFALTGTEQAA